MCEEYIQHSFYAGTTFTCRLAGPERALQITLRVDYSMRTLKAWLMIFLEMPR